MWSGFASVTIKRKLGKFRAIFYGGPMLAPAVTAILFSRNSSPSTPSFELWPEGTVRHWLILTRYGIKTRQAAS